MALIKVINGQKHIIAEKNITDHNKLENRDAYGCHPISAIRGLPEKISDLKTKDTELETKIDELTQKINIVENSDIPNVESSMTEKINNVKVQAKKINIVENSDNTFTFTNYGAESSKRIQAGFLPDNDTITLTDDKKVTLNKVYMYPQFIGDGTKDNPISILTDPQTIVPNNDNVLQAIGVHAGVDGVLLSGEYIYNEFTELNKDIGDLTNQINDDYTKLTNKHNEQDQKIIELQNRALGVGGYLTAYNFKKATPTQTELTNYAKQQLSITDETKIPNQTRVKNLYDNVVWILNNHSIDGQATFNWVSDGKDVVGLASNTEAGIVLGSNEDYQGSIDVNGHISINGLAEYITKNDTAIKNINDELPKYASLDEENHFTSINTFTQETNFSGVVEHSNNVNITNHKLKISDNSDGTKDIVTQYGADSITIEEQNDSANIFNLSLPKKSGTLATTKDITDKINLKYSTLKNVDTLNNKEDALEIGDEDASFSIYHKNQSQSGVNVAKDFVELSRTYANGGLIENTSVGISSDTITLKSSKVDAQDVETKNTIVISPSAVTLNDENVVTENQLAKKLDKIENTSSNVKIYAVNTNNVSTLVTLEDKLDNTSTNVVQNKVIKDALDGKINKLTTTEISRVYVRDKDGQDTSLPFTYTAEANSIAQRSPSGTLQVSNPTQDEDAVNKTYIETNYQGKLTPGSRVTINEQNKIDVVTNYIELSGESGTIHDDEYTMLQNDPMTVIKYGGNYYRLHSGPINGHGDYIFNCDYLDTADVETIKPYVIILKQDKT